MALSNHDQTRIREYLLGHLSDHEQQKIEERLMVEDELFEQFEISKGELIEEYCACELNQNDQHWFESHYLATKEGKQRHTFAVALNCLERPNLVERPAPFFDRLRSFLKQQPWAVATAGTVALVAVIVVGVLLSRPASPTSVALNLSRSESRRGPNDPGVPRVKLGAGMDELRISLSLPTPVAPGTLYRVELDSGLQSRSVKIDAQDLNSLLVVVPARDVPPGYYALKLFATSSGTEHPLPGDYRFIVE